MDGRTDRGGAVVYDGQVGPSRDRAPQARQFGAQTLHRLDDVGAGLALHIDHDRGLAPIPCADFGVLESVDDVGDITDLDRRSVAERNDNIFVDSCGGYLVIGSDGVGLMCAVERAFRSGDIGADDSRAQIVQRDAVGGEPR